MATADRVTTTSSQAGLKITLLATTDLHAHLTQFDYFQDRPDPLRGLEALTPIIAKLRRTFPNILLLDNGDTVQGTPLADVAAREDAPHPMITAMNALEYDAMGLGNHDFNYGLDFAQKIAQLAQFPVILSNVTEVETTGAFQKSVILKRQFTDTMGHKQALKIGLIGFVPPQILKWDRTHLAGRVCVSDITTTAAEMAKTLKAEGADLVVALCHSGLDRTGGDPSGENAAYAVAAIPQIDAMIFGHTHHIFPNPAAAKSESLPALDHYRGHIRGRVAVQPKFWGYGIGMIHLTLVQEENKWHVTAGHSAHYMLRRQNRPAPPDQPIHNRVLQHIRSPIGTTHRRLHSYFSMLGSCQIGTLLARAQKDAAKQYLTEQIGVSDLPLLAAVAPYKAGGRAGPQHYIDIPKGDLLRKHSAEICLYPNSLEVVEVTGEDLKDWLERSAACFSHIEDTPRHLIDPQAMSYNFDTIYGLKYEINLAKPARFDGTGLLCNPKASRVQNITYGGRPIEDEMRFLVATNSYRAGGGGHFDAPARGRAFLAVDNPPSVEDILARYITQHTPLMIKAEDPWHFTPLGGKVAVFETGHGAQDLTQDIQQRGLIYQGQSAQGFSQFKITL